MDNRYIFKYLMVMKEAGIMPDIGSQKFLSNDSDIRWGDERGSGQKNC